MIENSSSLSGPTTSTSKSKNKGGKVRIAAMWAVAIFAAVMFGMVPVSNRLGYHDTITKYNIYFPRVPQKMPDNEYWYVEGNNSKRKLAIFCMPAPPFDERQTLESLTFVNLEACWKVIHYDPLRDQVTGELILRDNP
jgi:hypothetical protein